MVVWTALDVCVDSGGKRPAVVSRWAAVDVCVDSGCKHPSRVINAVAPDVCGPRPRQFTTVGSEQPTCSLQSHRQPRSSPTLVGKARRCQGRGPICARELLGRAPAGVRTPLGERGTPLHEAATRGKLAIIKLLLDHGANPNRRDAGDDATPAGGPERRHRPAPPENQRPSDRWVCVTKSSKNPPSSHATGRGRRCQALGRGEAIHSVSTRLD
ncbi:MAG: hypothetical protein ACLPZR_17560 [Solirubrobacteraceae bacterium]